MKIRLADYVADFLVEHKVTDIFSVVGGGAMHLNDALGHHEKLHVTYNHHEQACAMAAESYARLENKIAAVCVTTGPGGTNALTGVVGGYLDSIPMFIISGQVRYDTTARFALKHGAKVRSMGDQEYDIVKSVEPMTKYAIMLEDPNDIRYVLERGWHLAKTGRPGPVWIDIPVNYQGMTIETDDLRGYDNSEDDSILPPPLDYETIGKVIDAIKEAKRPVFYAGWGIRLSGAYRFFRSVLEKLNIPVVTNFDSIDLIESDHPLYCGRGGGGGDRAGNFAVQNADVVLSVGSRLSIRQVGFNHRSWARAAKVIMVDIDEGELKKPTLHVEMPIWADAKDFLKKLDEKLPSGKLFLNVMWNEQCHLWKQKYPVVSEVQKAQSDLVNVYAFADYLGARLPEDSLTAVSNGACVVTVAQCYDIKKGTRIAINGSIASMGYGLPAAIGLCVAGGKRETFCLEGDGSVMMNLQELQTVITNKLPIKLFIINNQGYQSIRITQSNLFSHHTKVGIGPDSNSDVSFPNYQKLAKAFGFTYFSAHSNEEMKKVVDIVLMESAPLICEIFTDTRQIWSPKPSARKLPDGSLVSPPLEDLDPFLSREELKSNMFIPLLDESLDK